MPNHEQWRDERPRNYGEDKDIAGPSLLNLNKEERTEQTKRDEDEKLRKDKKSSSAKFIDH